MILPLLLISNVYAQESFISVQTNDRHYTHNDIIVVSGQVANVVSGSSVTITVINPLNSIVTIDKLNVANDGSFATTFNTAGAMWKYDGDYTVRVSYGDKIAESQFDISGVQPEPENNLSDKAIEMFEKKIDRWNNHIDRLNDRVDKLESKGKLDRVDEIRAKILVFESLVTHLESLIH